MKKISVILLVLILATSLTGCFNNETKLYNAFNKMQDITSAESDMEIGFTFGAEGFSEEEQMQFQQVAAMLNGTKLKMHNKTIQNKDKTIAKSEADMNLNLGGMGLDMKLWVDLDMSDDQYKMVEIIKIPQMFVSFISPQDPNKEYLVYDIEKIIEEENAVIDYNELMKFSRELQPKMTEFIKAIQKDFKPEFEIIKSVDDKEVNGEKLKMYELKLDDATLKELVKYTVNYSLDSEITIEFIKEYMNSMVDMVAATQGDNGSSEEDMIAAMEELENQIPEFKEKFNEFMEKYKDVKILGDKGILIEYGINNKGYIVYEAGNMDIRIDLEKISKALEETPAKKGIINFGINYSANTYNINSKDLKVEIPKVDEKNSINIMEMLEGQMNQME